jgi:GDP-L-fucose synthase
MTTDMTDDFDLAGKTVWVSGHRGMVGTALLRRLEREGCSVVTADRTEVDLRRQADVEAWLDRTRPDAAFLCAATVGGIVANDTRPAEFLYDNLAIEATCIHAAWTAGVEKLLFLGSACIYPKHAAQPMAEDALLTGPLEPTNEWYAVAKIAGIKLCQAYRKQYGARFISAQPINLYGPNDNFDLEGSHVLPALMRKAHEAKAAGAETMTVWGSGAPLREFMHVDDLADALVFLMRRYDDPVPINIGTGEEVSIADLARLVCRTVGFEGSLAFDASRPDGAPRKRLDVTRMDALGWRAAIGLEQGLSDTYIWFLENDPSKEAVARDA